MQNDKLLRRLLTWRKDYAGISTFYINEEEATFVSILHQRVPIWEIAQEVREAAFHDHAGILVRFYRVLLVAIGTFFAKYVTHMDWECFNKLRQMRALGQRPMMQYPHLSNFLLDGADTEYVQKVKL